MRFIEGLKNNSLYLKAYYRDYLTGYKMQYHFHPYVELMYVENGSCDIFILDENKTPKKINLKKGNAIILDNVYHKLIADTKHTVKMANLEFAYDLPATDFDFSKLIVNMPNTLSLLNKYGFIKIIDSNNIIDLILRLQKEQSESLANDPQQKSNYYCSLLTAELMLLIERNSADAIDFEGLYIKKAKQYIRENFMNEISVATISNHLDLSESYLFKIFKKETNLTLMDYVNRKRINMSIPLIMAKKLAIVDIALEVGFQSRQSFFIILKSILI